MEAEIARFEEVVKAIQALEAKNVHGTLQAKRAQMADVAKTADQLEAHYKKAQEKLAKEKADVDKMKEPNTRDFFKDQKSFDDKMSVEMEEYLEAVSEAEIAQKQRDGVAAQKKQLEVEVAEAGKQMEGLAKLYDEQDAILGKIFDGDYGSDLENRLESEVDAGKEKKERIVVAKYKWSNARILLEHAVKQLGVAVQKWNSLKAIPATNVQAKYIGATETRNNLVAACQNITAAQQYLNNIKFPYCEPGEIQTLQRATQNIYIDMQSNERHDHANKCFAVTHKRAAALKQWFDSVINSTIAKDLDKSKAELGPKEKALRVERLSLIRAKLGDKADSLTLGETDFDDDAELELQKVFEADKTEGAGGNTLGVSESDPRQPTPMPLKDLAPPPSQDELFGNIAELKAQHEKEMAEFEKAQETNKARMEQGLQEKLAKRRNKRARTQNDE